MSFTIFKFSSPLKYSLLQMLPHSTMLHCLVNYFWLNAVYILSYQLFAGSFRGRYGASFYLHIGSGLCILVVNCVLFLLWLSKNRLHLKTKIWNNESTITLSDVITKKGSVSLSPLSLPWTWHASKTSSPPHTLRIPRVEWREFENHWSRMWPNTGFPNWIPWQEFICSLIDWFLQQEFIT